MRIEGSFTVPAPRSEVYQFLTDPQRLVAGLPDIERSQMEGAGAFSVVARVGVGPMRGSLELRLRLTESEAERRAVYHGQGKGMGSTVELETGFALSDTPAQGTEVGWYGEAKIGGRLASVGGGLLEPLAKKNIARFVDAVRRALSDERAK